ncbi:helix-turn-helix domain-containing protein [Celerinatantimonas sp. YJH-8]|uniref:helix-turn-helix domain-containing protein n=1 Tax=Celerinatantimonas sp. YJH-8 TaxID=3228714 RepID=UPI0038C2C45D
MDHIIDYNVLSNYHGKDSPYNFSHYPIIGRSKLISQLRQEISRLSSLICPIVIIGEKGCETGSIALKIHELDHSRIGTFARISPNIHDAQKYRDNVLYSIENCINGTLYLEDIDTIGIDKQDQLTTLFSLFHLYQKIQDNNIRIMLSTNSIDPSFSNENQFINYLTSQGFSYSTLWVPPLRDRIEDLHEHVTYHISNLRNSIHISSEALQMLMQYDWPGNIRELQNYLFEFISHADDIIDKELLIIHKFPIQSETTSSLATKILNKDFDYFNCFHPGLVKVVHYMSDHYHEDLNLIKLGDISFISPSHLSYLFRFYLHTNFKSLLNEIRIVSAQHQLEQYPMAKITDIAYNVGFGDLSHFEKMFRRYARVSPRQFRKQQRNQKSFVTSPPSTL